MGVEKVSKQGSTPNPWARVCETRSKKGRARERKPSIHRVYSAQRGIGTMVSDHGLGRGQTMGKGRSEFAEKEGGGKPHEWPLPKRSFGPPPCTVRFPPLSSVSALSFLHKNPQQSRPEALEGSKIFGRVRSLVRSPPPIRFAPPLITAPKKVTGTSEKYFQK